MIIPRILKSTAPLFKEPLYVTRPNLPALDELTPLLDDILKKRWVTNFGDYHNELQVDLQDLLKVKHVVLCCNGTIALFLLLRALELKGVVLTTAFTFPATIHAVYLSGLQPRFCDIDPHTYTLDPESVKKNMTSDVSCILGVHLFGNACDIAALEKISAQRRIPIIFDSAHAFCSTYQNKPIGGFGIAEMFSFHATKLFTTIEGGAIATNDDALYKKLRNLINFGIKNEECVESAGLNGKMSEINAVFGILTLKKIKEILNKLKDLHTLYTKRLSKLPGIKLQELNTSCASNFQYMPVQVIPEEFGLTRDELYAALKEDNVFTRKYFSPPAHRYDAYKNEGFTKDIYLPHTDQISKRILCLPLYATLNEEDVIKICELIAAVQVHSKEIKALSQNTPAYAYESQK